MRIYHVGVPKFESASVYPSPMITSSHEGSSGNRYQRQREDWARDASQAFARGDVAAGLAAYAERGHVHLEADRTAARAAIVRDYLAAGAIDGSSLIVAHANSDVQAINQAVWLERQRTGDLSDEVPFQANRGLRQFAEGDRLVFLRNDPTLGVKNGTLATVERTASGVLLVRLDGGGQICIDQASYTDVNHGYAVTLHKAQGVTVDRLMCWPRAAWTGT